MRQTDEEQAMLAGEAGPARQWALQHQLEVGRFFDAPDLVPVAQAHIMADTESLGEAGVTWLEDLARLPEDVRRVTIPTITDPRGADFKAHERIKQDSAFVELERRAVEAFRALGVLMTDTCINYQSILPPVKGEHLAMGDTGVVIYSNSVLGARSNFEGGPSALAAALTGRTPRYGFHLEERRRATARFAVRAQPRDLTDWGALGGVIGRAMASYWEVPVIEGIEGAPNSDQLKHFGAALASHGSTPLFHMVGVTPEAPDLGACGGAELPVQNITQGDLEAFIEGYRPADDKLDVVVFAGPQLSLMELHSLATLLEGRCIHPDVSLLAATSPEFKSAADRMGLTETIEAAGGVLLEGVCFYQMHARELGEANGWVHLMSNSAKIVNILGGYGYEPVLGSMARCVESAVAGRIVG